MEEQEKPTEKILEAGGEMIETYRNLITLGIVEHTSLGASVSIMGLLYLIFIVFVLLFAGLGAAWWLGESMNNMKAGFFIVGGVYTVLLVVMAFIARKVMIPTIRNMIIKKIYEQD